MKILPIFIPHLGCPGNCVYCDQNKITKSELPQADIIQKLCENFCRKNAAGKKEIAFFGGTFTNLPFSEQQFYFDLIKPYLDDNTSIRLSTRPDAVSPEILDFCRRNGVRTIELGVQSFYDEVLSAARRNYTAQDAVSACRLIRQEDFFLGIQLMPGLPGFSRKSLNKTIQTTLMLKPDMVRIYPTIVLCDTELADWFAAGLYHPLTLEEAVAVSAEMINAFRQQNIKIIKIGLHSDIMPQQILAGPYHQSFGELVRGEIYFAQLQQNFSDQTLSISPADVSLFKGYEGRMLCRLKSALKIEKIPILIDMDLTKGRFLFTDISPQDFW